MSPTPQTAILLAAGASRRLKELTRDRPKCLLEVGGVSLLARQVDALRRCGITRVVVVTGYCADQVRAAIGPRSTYVHNEVYATTNSVYSLHLAAEHGQRGFVLANADVLFHPSLLETLLRAPHPDALLYEPAERLGDEEMKVRVERSFVTAIAKDLPAGTYHGENLGIVRFSAAGARRLFEETERLVAAGEVNAWAPRAFDAMCRERPIAAIRTGGLAWTEVDFPEDLEHARRVVWPRIEEQDVGLPVDGSSGQA